MANEFGPLSLKPPVIADRRRDRSRPIPLSPELVARKREIAQTLLSKVEPLSTALNSMSEEQRRNIFFRLEHDGKIDLTGTGLKAISSTSDSVTLAVPKAENLSALTQKIEQFRDRPPDRNGMVPHGALVTNLKSIETASCMDRLSEDLRSRYVELIAKDSFVFEIEVLTLVNGPRNQASALAILRSEIDGYIRSDSFGALFEHTDIKATSRMVIRTSGAVFKGLVEDGRWQSKISYFEARPKFQTFSQIFSGFETGQLGQISAPAEDAPIVCIIDSGVASGNPFLKAVSRESLFKSFLKKAPDDTSDGHGHGSGVASLAAYYAIDISLGAKNTGRAWVASARILDENNFCEDDRDGDEGRLFSEVLKEVVATFAPLGVKIFNLSVNDERRRWDADSRRLVPRNSWVARTIDVISRQYDVIFVISTGNISIDEVRSLKAADVNYPGYMTRENARLLDPAQSALGLTVGSIVHSTTLSGHNAAADSAMGHVDWPSPFSRRGPGINGETKPELIERGGNFVAVGGGGVGTNIGTNVVVASKDVTSTLTHNSGTSLAAPRVVHAVATTLQSLTDLGIEASACLLKALTVNSASLPVFDSMDSFSEGFPEEQRREILTHLYGYGIPDRRKAVEADRYSAIVYFDGLLPANKVAFLSVPVPKELATASRGTKRATVTVAYYPEVQRWGLENYFGVSLKWRMFRGDVQQNDVIEAMSIADDEENIAREAAEKELLFQPGITLRSKGSVQHAVFEWTLHREEFSQNQYTLALASSEKWGRVNPPDVPYAVVVRIEDLSRSCEVQAHVRAAIEVPVVNPTPF
jgi:hypothetical protein